MSRIFFFGSPFVGHLNPTLPIAVELQRRGHEVAVFNYAPLGALIESAGLAFRDYAEYFAPIDAYRNPDEALDATFQEHLETAFVMARTALDPLQDLLASQRPNAVVVDELALGAQYACETLRVPLVSSLITLPIVPSFGSAVAAFTRSHESYRGILDLFRRMRTFRRTHGIPQKRPDPLNHSSTCAIVYTSRLFQSDPVFHSPPYCYIGASLAAVDESLISSYESRRPAASIPRIFVAFGTLYNRRKELFETIFEALGGRGWEVSVALGSRLSRTDLGAIPEGLDVRPSFPQVELLARASVFLTHGGLGSVTESLYCGCPMLVLPQAVDQYRNAERVVELGAGRSLKPEEAWAPAILEEICRILGDDRYRQRALEVGNTIRAAGGARRGADAIEVALEIERSL